MPSTVHVALVPEGIEVDPSEVTRVSAAVSKQVQQDFAPIWGVSATVDPFVRLEDVPIGYWPILIMKTVQGAEGYHQDKNGQPYSIIAFHNEWSITASHECLEMLADPYGSTVRPANLLDQAVRLGQTQGPVEYLVEVCDPSEDAQFSYQIGGVRVSDFYTPDFFNPTASAGTQYSFTGAIDGPRKVLDGGYISWHDPVSNHWFQLRMFADDISSASPHVVDLTTSTAFEKHIQSDGLRGASDRVAHYEYWKTKEGPSLTAARQRVVGAEKARGARADDLRSQINDLVKSFQRAAAQ
jgi:hypothetical protein